MPIGCARRRRRIGSSASSDPRSTTTGSARRLAGPFVTARCCHSPWTVASAGTRYRLVPGTAVDGLLVAVPPAADGTGPFAFGPPIRRITIAAGPHGRDSAATLTYQFLSAPLAGP